MSMWSIWICTFAHTFIEVNIAQPPKPSQNSVTVQNHLSFFLVYLNRNLLFQRQNIIAGMNFRIELINTFNLYMRIGLRTRGKWPYKIRNEFASLPGVQFFFLFFWRTNHLLFSFGSNIFSFLRHNLHIIKSTFLKNILSQYLVA